MKKPNHHFAYVPIFMSITADIQFFADEPSVSRLLYFHLITSY